MPQKTRTDIEKKQEEKMGKEEEEAAKNVKVWVGSSLGKLREGTLDRLRPSKQDQLQVWLLVKPRVCLHSGGGVGTPKLCFSHLPSVFWPGKEPESPVWLRSLTLH